MRAIRKLVTSTIVASGLMFGLAAPAVAQPASNDFVPGPGNATPYTVSDGPSLTSTGERAASSGTCQLVIWPVGWDTNTNWLGIRGGREGCDNHATFRVELRKNVWFRPDEVLASTAGEWNNNAVYAYAPCKGRGTYFGRVVSSTGNTKESARKTVCP